MDQITIQPIGIVHSPYKEDSKTPAQGIFKPDTQAVIELDENFAAGLKDLDGFSHAIILYHFHQSQKQVIQGAPLLESDSHGIFAIRSPYRPNHIGMSIVKIQKIQGNKLFFTEVDILDNTPVIDIKPYVKYFDRRENTTAGWLEKHFKNGRIPDKALQR